MKDIKKIIGILLIISIVVCISIVIYLFKEQEENNFDAEPDISREIETNAKAVDNFQTYLYVKQCIEKYYNQFSMIHEKDKYIEYYGYSEEFFKTELEENIKSVYKLFDEKYIETMNIQEDNFVDKYENFSGVEFYIDEIYEIDIDYSKQGYFVYGRERNLNDEISNLGYIVKLDKSNYTFSLYEYEYMKEKNYIDKNMLNGECFTDKYIEENGYNKLEYQSIDEEIIVKEYFNLYKKNLIYDLDNLYNLLNEEYSKIKFGSIESFKEYIKENYNRLARAVLDQYQVNKYDNYTQYVCIDTNGNYYIFNETAVMKYTVMLDNYIIDLPKNVEKYNAVSNKTKVKYNINKFILAINDKNYYYAYNLLNEEFRQNYFDTQEKFENYIKNNFYNDNEVILKVYKDDGGLHTYTAQIKNGEDDSQSINKTFIVLLGENMDFELSFNV